MPFFEAFKNMVVLTMPVAIYAIVVRWKYRVAPAEIFSRLGLRLCKTKYILIAGVVSFLSAATGILASNLTKNSAGQCWRRSSISQPI